MQNNMNFEAASTSRLAINHDLEQFPQKWQDRTPSRQKKVANAVQLVLSPRLHKVEPTDTIADLERIFGISGFGPSLLLGAKSLIGKTLVYDGMRVQIQESGTSFAVRSVAPAQVVLVHAANDERFTLAA